MATGEPSLLGPRDGHPRPPTWLDADPDGTLQRMYDERADLYREVADRIVTSTGSRPSEVADRVLERA